MVESICLVLDAHHEYTVFLQFERNVFKQSQTKKLAKLFLIFLI
jgi:hypothetical protein